MDVSGCTRLQKGLGNMQKNYQVKNIFHKLKKAETTVTVPGSKSITNRALLLATLADGDSLLKGALFSDDSRYFLKCIQSLGFEAVADEEKKEVSVKGLGGRIPNREASLYVGSAGTAARFLAAFLGMSEGSWHLDASEQMRRRPMKPLLDKLSDIGAEIVCEKEEGHFPFQITGHGVQKREVSVNIDRSSQFLSAMLISSCLSEEGMRLTAEGQHGMAYIDMTVEMMKEFGISCKKEETARGISYEIEKGQTYQAGLYQIEPDVSAAAYFFAMAAILGIRVTVRDVRLACKQGDIEFVRILEKMGCCVEETKDGVAVTGPSEGRLKGICADMHACSDQAITLAAIAPFADGPVTITGIGHIRFQESDRLAAMAAELGRMGIVCETTEDSITIRPGRIQPAVVQTYDDHRMAMGFSLVGLRAEGIEIADPGCCRKTFENYFEVLDQVIDELTGERKAADTDANAAAGKETGANAAFSTPAGRIEGSQIYLRPITMADTNLIVKWRNTERVRSNFIYQALFTKEGHENWMRTKVAAGEVIQFIICEKEKDRPVGSVYFRDIDPENKKAEYGIFIGEADAAGKGIGSETARLAVAYAKDVMKLHKLMLRVFADNIGAVKSYENAGFVREACLKDEYLQNGRYRDLLLMAVIFEENR